MAGPVIAAKEPKRVELKEGQRVFWCRCGLSKTQPFCDGAHQGTDIDPVAFKAPKSGPYFFCQCKATGDQPLCDGAHQNLAGDAGDPARA